MRCLTLWSSVILPALAVTCYYPNGTPSADGVPCSNNDTVMCCPDKWQCLSNGICHYQPDNTWGRYSCTDKTWGGSCPSKCIRKVSQQGNEAILQCSNGQWCCDTNHPELASMPGRSCCDAGDNSAYFDFGNGIVFAQINGTEAIATSADVSFTSTTVLLDSTTLPIGSVSGNSASSSETSAVSSLQAPTASVSTTRSYTSNENGHSLTSSSPVPGISISPLSPLYEVPSSTSPPSASSNALVVGLAVAVPTSIIAFVILSWFLCSKFTRKKGHRRHENISAKFGPGFLEKQDSEHENSTSKISDREPPLAPSEIDSREVRIVVSQNDTVHSASTSSHFLREETTDTLYPHARPNYSIAISPSLSQSLEASASKSNHQDYSGWAVTPCLQYQRWSETANREAGIVPVNSPNGGGIEQDAGQNVHEVTGRARIPFPIAELP
ncbi:uncharacterized protein PV09_02121 [Verruconis gallopava]|uniref:Mid2 domain-containing protein n=1 Tax=Verruconis gallopava TaxID=253628 RepID=A0A0D1XWT5_9PEZI|nr:uncharacterized protein PV09_02121 [Verruconis gallopava]KIW07266.1 hypothetical protein PV09_02121 [Verruconis gallopava]